MKMICPNGCDKRRIRHCHADYSNAGSWYICSACGWKSYMNEQTSKEQFEFALRNPNIFPNCKKTSVEKKVKELGASS